MGGKMSDRTRPIRPQREPSESHTDNPPFPPRPPSGGSPPPAQPPIRTFTLQDVCDVLKGGDLATATAVDIQRLMGSCVSVAGRLGVGWSVPPGTPALETVYSIRSAVVNAFERAAEVFVEARSHGILLPDDPLPRIREINAARSLFETPTVPPEESRELLNASIDLIAVAMARDSGGISFTENKPSVQVASFEVSIDGIVRPSGDPLVDLLGYQPDANFIKRKRALDSLTRLDFSKRKPYLLFTADIITDGRRQSGTIVCWSKMRDASGYTIHKRDVFGGLEFQSSSVTAELAEQITQRLRTSPDFIQILSFYDWLTPADVVAIVDLSSQAGALYSYSIVGIQTRAPINGSFFDTPMSSLYLSQAQADEIRALIATEAARISSDGTLDSVSPYPAISQVVYGDPGYGWIIAGCNVFGARRRGDSAEEIRSYTYLGSRASSVLTAGAAGRLFLPNDLSAVHAAIEHGIASYGISQTILSILDGTGTTLFTAYKDDPLGFEPTQQSLESVSRGLARILAVIDPEGAVLDPRVLAATLATPLSPAQQTRYSAAPVPTASRTGAPDEETLTRAFGSQIMDLTTYSGISRMMQVIRTIYDFYPGALV